MKNNAAAIVIAVASSFATTTLAEPASPQAQTIQTTAQAAIDPAAQQRAKEALGAMLFHDASLSNPAGQSCASCHGAAGAFADPGKVVSEGAVKGAFGHRNAPSLKYAKFSPPFQRRAGGDWRGGQFWDGRADSLKQQALVPFYNPLEMNTTPAQLAKALRSANYQAQISAAYGKAALSSDSAITQAAADALEAFQQTEVFAPFDSKYDYARVGLIELSPQEMRGEDVFNTEASCIDCHLGSINNQEIFSRFVHHNILVPRNPKLPFYSQPKAINPQGEAFIDIGTAANPALTPEEKLIAKGIFKTPTLRNIALTGPYMHNGVFTTLEEVIDFYNKIEDFGPPEVSENKSNLLALSLRLSEDDKKALLAFLHTLTDGYPASPELKAQLKAYQQRF